jgi:pectinesterase
MKLTLIFSFVLLLSLSADAAKITRDIIVAADGSGDFKTITEAVASLPMYNYERRVIFIKNGIYNERIRIEQDYITLRGESKDSTIIRFALPRPDWEKNKDWTGPGIINIYGDDLILENLTVENIQTQPVHAFVLYGTGNRVVTLNCNFISDGGDTVSLWNYKSGMYYHADCYFKGQVDFLCPRGWCFVRNCRFFEVKQTASIWHSGAEREEQKFVLTDCYFDGIKGFQLGRHHYEAQFYLLNCKFSKNMADKAIYRVDDTIVKRSVWGNRCYYNNCKGDSVDYKWFANNLNQAKGKPKVSEISAKWTFDGVWDPEDKNAPVLKSVTVKENTIWLTFNENLSIIDSVKARTSTGKSLTLKQSRGITYILQFKAETILSKKDLAGPITLTEGKIIASAAGRYERKIPETIHIEQVRE